MRAILALWCISLTSAPLWCFPTVEQQTTSFIATAYSQKGQTASGKITRVGLVAADPAVLPLGTRISVTGAGPYSGEYIVADTGALVKGKHIDIFMPSRSEALRFGKKHVTVQVRRLGRGRRSV